MRAARADISGSIITINGFDAYISIPVEMSACYHGGVMDTMLRVRDQADIAYVRANYGRLADVCGLAGRDAGEAQELIAQSLLPRESYRLEDGTDWYPWDLFGLIEQSGGAGAVKEVFALRCRAAAAAPLTDDDVAGTWQAYLSGAYGVCLKQVAPETIVRKGGLMGEIDRLAAAPAPKDATWRRALRSAVDELDALERPFAAFDRERFGRPVSRDTHITAVRARFPEAFR